MVLIMPEDLSIERAQTMKAFGAELVLTPKSGGMEYARDLADQMVVQGKGRVLDQFANPDNPRIHYETTGPELWADTHGKITHFVSAMGTTGTITGVSRFLKEKNPAIRIVGAQPDEGSRIPGIRKWPQEYLPKIYDPSRVDQVVNVSRSQNRKVEVFAPLDLLLELRSQTILQHNLVTGGAFELRCELFHYGFKAQRTHHVNLGRIRRTGLAQHQ